jgi:PAS domain-containing protein
LGEGISPAMSNSVIEKFSQIDIDNSIQELLKEVNESIKQFSIQNQSSSEVDNINNSGDKGGMQVDKLELVAKYNLTVEQLDFNIDEVTIEELEERLKEFTNKVNKPEATFSATYRQKRSALENALDPIIVKDDDGSYVSETYFYVSDFSDEYVFVEKSYWDSKGYERTCGRFTYTFDETNVTATITSDFEKMITDVWLTEAEYQKLQEDRNNATAEYEKIKGEFEEYKNKYSTPNEEVVRLQEFETKTLKDQRQTDETELFSKFDEELNTDEQYKTLKSESSKYTLEELEIKCFAMLGKKKANFSLNKKDNSTIKIKVEHKEETEQDSPYGDLHSKYLK